MPARQTGLRGIGNDRPPKNMNPPKKTVLEADRVKYDEEKNTFILRFKNKKLLTVKVNDGTIKQKICKKCLTEANSIQKDPA